MKHLKLETTPEISHRMANVSLKRGIAETKLAKALWHYGFRYRFNWKSLPGSPDIAIRKYKIAVFVDGEFWHAKTGAFERVVSRIFRTFSSCLASGSQLTSMSSRMPSGL